MKVRSVGICVKPGEPSLAGLVRELEKWLVERRIEVWPDAEAGRFLGGRAHLPQDLAAHVDLVIVLGGDGTLLAVAREIGASEVPILGVNLGQLGFLAEVAPEEQLEVLDHVLRGQFETVARMRLEVRAERSGAEIARALALNDLVIKAELPDMTREDIEVTVENNTLTLRGTKKPPVEVKDEQFRRIERQYGTFVRSFTLPNTVDPSRVAAEYRHGVLTVKLPFREEAKPRTINVEVAA